MLIGDLIVETLRFDNSVPMIGRHHVDEHLNNLACYAGLEGGLYAKTLIVKELENSCKYVSYLRLKQK